MLTKSTWQNKLCLWNTNAPENEITSKKKMLSFHVKFVQTERKTGKQR